MAVGTKDINSLTHSLGDLPWMYEQKHGISDLTKWSIFALLEPDFILEIRVAFVYGRLGQEALMITKDDKVYAIGDNSLGRLGSNTSQNPFLPRVVTDLCKKGIKTFDWCKESNVVALTHDGKVYFTEGKEFIEFNGAAQTVFGDQTYKTVVKKMACGSNHIVTLMDDGQMYVWKQETPLELVAKKIFSFLSNDKIIEVACTHSSCFALTAAGKVYAWGSNVPCQQSFGTGLNVLEAPTKVEGLDGVRITKIVGGYTHILALSTAGEVYVLDPHKNVQMGIVLEKASAPPTKLRATTRFVEASFEVQKTNSCFVKLSVPDMGRVLDIAAMHFCDISVAIATPGQLYMWGVCGGVAVKTPILTPYKTVYDVFANFATPRVMHRPLIIDPEDNHSLATAVQLAFDDPESSDLTIEVEGKPIHVHKAILKIRSEYFRTMFQSNWAEDQQRVIEHNEFPYNVYKGFLKYLYTDKIDLDAENALELLHLANKFLDNRLRRHCENAVINEITTSNAMYIYATAVHYGYKDLEEISFSFALGHMTEVMQSPDVSKLDEGKLKAFVKRAAEEGAFRT